MKNTVNMLAIAMLISAIATLVRAESHHVIVDNLYVLKFYQGPCVAQC